MESVTVSRRIDASPATVTDAMADIGAFVRAAGFDNVSVDDDRIHLTNHVGVVEIDLDLELVDREGAVLAYEQRDGIFDEMWTEYRVEEVDSTPSGRKLEGGTRVEATTAFELGAAFVGPIFDATVVKRQRRRELESQLDYLEELSD